MSLPPRRWAALPAIVAATVVAACAPATALGAEIALLKSDDVAAWRPAVESVVRGLATHKITEIDLRADRTRGELLVSGLKGKAAVIVAFGPLATQLAHELLPDTPLVFCMVQDPERSGINVGRPTVTGVSFSTPVRNQLAAFHLVHPLAERVGVLYNETSTGALVEEARKAAGLVGIKLAAKAVTAEKDVPSALRSLLKETEAIWLIPEPLLLGDQSRRHILTETLASGKPIFAFSAALVAEGALASSGPDYASVGDRAAELVARLIAGERRIEMVVPRSELAINTKVATQLKIPIPASVLKAAKTY